MSRQFFSETKRLLQSGAAEIALMPWPLCHLDLSLDVVRRSDNSTCSAHSFERQLIDLFIGFNHFEWRTASDALVVVGVMAAFSGLSSGRARSTPHWQITC